MKNYCGWINTNTFSGDVYEQALADIERYQFMFVGENEHYQDGWIYLNGTRMFGSDLISNWSRQYEYPYVAQNIIEADKNASILDIGVGYSFFPFYLHSLGYDVTGGDILDLTHLYKDTGVKFVKDDITKTAIKEKFDIIYSISVFEHIDDKEAAIENIFDLLKPGGKLILTVDCDLDMNIDKHIPNYAGLTNIISLIDKKLVRMNPYDLNRRDSLVTTVALNNSDSWRLPWKQAVRKGFLGKLKNSILKKNTQAIPAVAVFVGTWQKPISGKIS